MCSGHALDQARSSCGLIDTEMKRLEEVGPRLDIEPEGMELCPECQGVGSIEGEFCEMCDGLGFVDVDIEQVSEDFDKFMGRILQEEKRGEPAAIVTDSPQRLRAARHQERPLGRTRIGFAR